MIEVGLGVSRGKDAMRMGMHRMREILLNADKDANAFDEIWEWMQTRILTKAFASGLRMRGIFKSVRVCVFQQLAHYVTHRIASHRIQRFFVANAFALRIFNASYTFRKKKRRKERKKERKRERKE